MHLTPFPQHSLISSCEQQREKKKSNNNKGRRRSRPDFRERGKRGNPAVAKAGQEEKPEETVVARDREKKLRRSSSTDRKGGRTMAVCFCGGEKGERGSVLIGKF